MKRNLFQSKTFLAVFFAATLMSAASCSHKIGSAQSSEVSAAQGSKMKKEYNNNYKLEVSVTNLAPPNRLQPHVVWIETEQAGIKNIGQLNSESGFLLKALKANLTAITPYKPMRLFITAEDNAAI